MNHEPCETCEYKATVRFLGEGILALCPDCGMGRPFRELDRKGVL